MRSISAADRTRGSPMPPNGWLSSVAPTSRPHRFGTDPSVGRNPHGVGLEPLIIADDRVSERPGARGVFAQGVTGGTGAEMDRQRAHRHAGHGQTCQGCRRQALGFAGIR